MYGFVAFNNVQQDINDDLDTNLLFVVKSNFTNNFEAYELFSGIELFSEINFTRQRIADPR